MKYLITLCLFVSLATVAWTSSASWGRRTPYDKILYQENVLRFAQNGNYHSVVVNFPRYGQGNFKNITAIDVFDRFRNASGAQPYLWSGGPGYKSATVNLKSQYSRGVNSTVVIYG